jgi:hypothetical protein
MTATSIHTAFYAHYAVTATIDGVPDIEKPARWEHVADKVMRPSGITIEYKMRAGKTMWGPSPGITVHGTRIRKDGSPGANIRMSFTYDSEKAPQWVHDFIKENPPPQLTIS